MSLIRRQRTFLLCTETYIQKWARMLVKTGKAFVDSSAMTTQIREDSDFSSLPLFHNLYINIELSNMTATRKAQN